MIDRHALRALRRTPAFTIAALLTLVLGLSAAGSMFAVVHGVLLAPLPYGDPERLVSVGLRTDALQRMAQPPAVYLTYERYARTLDAVAFYRTGNANIWIEGDNTAPERVTATWVTASAIPLLQAAPLLGRSFSADEERAGGPGAVVISEAEWRTRFGAAPDIIGRTLIANSVPREIVGVMPAGFAFPTADTRIWLPVKLPAGAVVEDFSYSGMARLAAGATAARAERELAAVLPNMAAAFPRLQTGGATATWLDEAKPAPVVQPLREYVTGGIARTLWMLAGAAALVLFAAWANVANLMLVRADSRRRDLAVREALGAGRMRTATHFLGESMLLGAAAGALALLAVAATVRILVAFGPADVPRLAELTVGPATVGFVALLALIGSVVCAAVPALRLRSMRTSVDVQEGGRGTAGRAQQRLRAAIVVAQIAMALVVSVGSAVLLRSAQRLHDVHPGFDTDGVTVLWTQLPFARYDDAAAVAFYARLGEQVRQLPSVQAAGLTIHVPLGDGQPLQHMLRASGSGRTLSLPVNIVDDGYFAAMRIPLIAGRGFRRLDLERGTDIVIDRRAAAALFDDPSGASAVGRRVALEPAGPAYTVVGVVDEVRDHALATPPVAMVYRPQVVPADPAVEPGARRSMALLVKSDAPLDALVPAIRRIVRDLDPTVPLFGIEAMDDVARASTARLSLALALMAAAAAITLLLGAIGLYGVMAYTVALRRREFGVRFALGADPRRLGRAVVGRALLLTAGGVAAGLCAYAFAAPWLQAFLYGVTATDPVTLSAATLVLAATASLASWLPARRAARIDPAEALRA